jgi:hypothetical protein
MEARDLRFGADPERGGPSLDLERGLVTTDEDVAALRRARAAAQRMSMAEYLDFLASFPDEDPARLRLRRGPGGSEPFTL